MSKTSYTLDWFGGRVIGVVDATSIKALREVAADLKQVSSDEAPIEIGDLKGNAATDESRIAQGVIFVGYNLPYAVPQHERLDYNHPRGGKAKFLEDPYNANKRKYLRHIGDAIDEATR